MKSVLPSKLQQDTSNFNCHSRQQRKRNGKKARSRLSVYIEKSIFFSVHFPSIFFYMLRPNLALPFGAQYASRVHTWLNSSLFVLLNNP